MGKSLVSCFFETQCINIYNLVTLKGVATRSSAIAEGPRHASWLAIEILPIAMQQCRNYLYDTS